MPFTGLDLPSRAGSALTRNGITTADALLRLSARELRALPGVGPSTVNQVLDALAAADLVLAEDPWAPYVCARDSRQASDADLATFFLCALCTTQYANGAFSGAQPEWRGTQLIEGYCGHCNELGADSPRERRSRASHHAVVALLDPGLLPAFGLLPGLKRST
jgi:Bacterial RNA polymerase, alpha chain C terminal domain